VFSLLAVQQKRGQDVFYRVKRSPFTNVLKKMQNIEYLPDGKSRVDRMWERLLEIVLFFRTRQHRKPVEILKSFISVQDAPSPRLTPSEAKRLRDVFAFLESAYKSSALAKTRLATDQTHFYTMVTSLIGGDLLTHFENADLSRKLVAFAQMLEQPAAKPKDRPLAAAIRRYQDLSARQTTDVARRNERQKKFVEIISAL